MLGKVHDALMKLVVVTSVFLGGLVALLMVLLMKDVYIRHLLDFTIIISWIHIGIVATVCVLGIISRIVNKETQKRRVAK